MPKKTINLLLIILLVGLFIFLIYFFFFREGDGESERLDRQELFDPFGQPFPSTTIDDFIDQNQFQIDFDGESRLKQITKEPVSGFDIFIEEFNDEGVITKKPIFKYIERATGHIYKTTYDSNENTRISNITIPKSHESIFLDEGNKVIYRFLDENDQQTIKTYLARFDFNNSNSEEEIIDDEEEEKDDNWEPQTLNDPTLIRTSGLFFIDNLTQLIKSNDNKLFGLLSNKNTSGFNSLGFLININNINNVDVILNSQISEWRGQWIGENRIALTTRTSYKTEGYSYILNPNTGLFLRDLGPIQGLSTTYSPNGKYVIYSSSNENNTQSAIYNRETNMEIRSYVGTIADKCFWSNDSIILFCATPFYLPSQIPDSWYKGKTSFNDVIISYNMGEGRMRILNQYQESLAPSLDIINIKVSDDNNFVLFQNKTDLSLWVYDLRE